MGNTLQQPITTKTTKTGGDYPDGIKWGVSAMQGWRLHMEDVHIAEEIREVWDPERNEIIWLEKPHYFFGVLDGHGGNEAAKFCSEHLLKLFKRRHEFVKYARTAGRIREHPTNPLKIPFHKFPLMQSRSARNDNDKNGNDNDNTKASTNTDKPQRISQDDSQVSTWLQRALENTFVELDLELLNEMVKDGTFELAPGPAMSNSLLDASPDGEGEDWSVELTDPEMEVMPPSHKLSDPAHSVSGTTITVTFVTPDMIICANVGDSRTILDAYPLSTDHKPKLPQERKRIEEAMGTVNFARVDGELAVSRALGDYEFKTYNQNHLIDGILDMESKRNMAKRLKVSPFPEVTCRDRSKIDRALILACDGVFDVMSSIDCHDLVQALCEEGEKNIGLIAEEVLDQCLMKGSRDNMTILVSLLPGQTFGEGGGVLKRRRKRPKTEYTNGLCSGRCHG